MTRKLLDRLLSKVDPHPTGCWIWTASTCDGYGRLQVGERKQLAHRVAHELFVGPIPDGLCALHRCDNRPCVRPDHLFLGTVGDNNRDRAAKGRNGDNRGECNGRAALTERQVRAIRTMCASGVPHGDVAGRFGVSRGTISFIARRATWAHVD